MSKLFIIKSYSDFNQRRYGAPWIAVVGSNARLDFSHEVGDFTGDRNGNGGDLYLFEPVEGKIYAWGQKDYRRPDKSEVSYGVFRDGALVEISRTEIIKAIKDSPAYT